MAAKDEDKDKQENKEAAPRRRRRSGEAQAAAESGEDKPKRTRARRAPAPKAGGDEPEATGQDAGKPKGRGKAEAAAESAESAPAPARRRGSGAVTDTPPVVRAQARYVRSSARKARLVCDHLRGKSVDEARAILAYAPRAVARDWSKVLESAVANAEHNHELVGDDLRVREAYADEGPTLKRYRPRAMGRATRIRKRTSHLTITLTPKE